MQVSLSSFLFISWSCQPLTKSNWKTEDKGAWVIWSTEPGSRAEKSSRVGDTQILLSYKGNTMTIRHFIVVQSFSHVWLFATPWTAACQVSLSFTISWNLLKFMSIELVMSPNHFILCHLLLFLPSIFPSIRVFSNEMALHIRWPKYWSFSISISPSIEYSGLISFWMGWFDLAVPGTLKSLLQHYSSKASILWHSAFFMVLLLHPYMTTGKT